MPAKNYIYPQPSTVDYFANKGTGHCRIAVLWERLQIDWRASLHNAEMRRLDGAIDYATSKGMRVIVDVHNYARYGGMVSARGACQ